jgi:hypothetical protein
MKLRAPSAIFESSWPTLSPSRSRWSCRPERSTRGSGASGGRGASNAASLALRTRLFCAGPWPCRLW